MNKGTPSERYHSAIATHEYVADSEQERAVAALDRVWRDLAVRQAPGVLERTRSRLTGKPIERDPVRGLYLWGGVGRGKTFLMDIFFHALPFEDKLRLHFHRFMQQVHAELKTLKDEQDTLRIVAERLAKRTRVICFDEFFVSDIADAMILGRLFQHLFRYGVTLVATSNIPPDELYKNGLQRRRFLPAIEQIKRYCEIMNLDASIDYRLRMLEKAEIYHWPLDGAADRAMEEYFKALSPEEESDDSHKTGTEHLIINNRSIRVRRLGEGVAWFDFSALCEGPRSASDYIEVAREFHTVFISNIPILDSTKENEARRFVALVDELYDHQVKLITSAEESIYDLYRGTKQQFEFQRTQSRLIEMQHKAYLALPHAP